jgi:hypothetical protein
MRGLLIQILIISSEQFARLNRQSDETETQLSRLAITLSIRADSSQKEVDLGSDSDDGLADRLVCQELRWRGLLWVSGDDLQNGS